MKKNSWTIIYHTADSSVCPHIHHSFYEKSNPSANILYADGREYFLPTPYHSKKVKNINLGVEIDFSKMARQDSREDELRNTMIHNHDKFLRDWIKDNIHKITTNNVAFFEWDVLLNKELPLTRIEGLHFWNALPPGHSMVWGDDILNRVKDVETLVSPFAGFYTNKDFIEQMISDKYDYLYEQDIFCEVRISILAHLTGVKPETNREIFNQPNPLKKPESLNREYKNKDKVPIGCFHPIKQKII